MAEETRGEARLSVTEVVVEALKGIKSEVLIYAVAVAALFVGSSSFGLDVLREVKWPLLFIFTVALVAYFFARRIPQARAKVKKRQKEK